MFAAIIAVGLRCLCRPREICEISLNQLAFDKPESGFITIFVQWYKTDQDGDDTDDIPIEPVKDNLLCPVRIIKEYLKLCVNKKKNDPLFTKYNNNEYLPTSFISEVVKKVASFGGSNRHVSGHSFKIGAASQLIAAGESIEMVGFAGRWASAAKNRYIRRSQLIRRDLSNKIMRDQTH